MRGWCEIGFAHEGWMRRAVVAFPSYMAAPTSVRLPPPLRAQLAAAAAAEERTVSAVVVSLLERGLVERARERELLRRMVADLDARPV